MAPDLPPQPQVADAGLRIVLPPPFDLVRTDRRDVLAVAVDLAPDHGAGTLVLHQSPGLLAFAVVLEPDRPLHDAQHAFVLGMAALADALAVHCPPERPVRLRWPDQVIFDAARLGGGRLAVPPDCAEDAVPDWLVFAADLIADRDHVSETGRFPDSTSLREEAFDADTDIVATFASYLMLYFDRWTHRGFDAVAEEYLARVDPPLVQGARLISDGRMQDIAPSGAIREHAPLRDALLRQDWRTDAGPVL
ncbi:Biotin-(acetyl-CoA carboxylase) ligase [Loktanella fryxellensis]|uniref:Biotin-(Acetyl-CoA carboxylase) ligase n=1 Tax=Loktanella fryxellensis TaxID=245187 RepID=A0A1H8B5Y5_9RHOB|nr:biotin/lipoate--protein ligase family protein [Loktanella fryxellensis]SEM78166.1 Biotin-(acetyl-CoA carboxylase) ligase [Loktanella fryxellensis]